MPASPSEEFQVADEVFDTLVEDEMSDSFLAYALSVITSRAIPDVRDGLKPVQRRILYAMNEQGIRPGTPHKKCARVVGETMGKYHPHGDSAIYEALVRMAQPFSLRVPLVDPHGNFGTLDDPPAASRYTECRMTQAAVDMIGEIDEDGVDMRDNYDQNETEPSVLPSKIPNLLVNGVSGIAVGMATKIPPHNLIEVVNAARALLDDPDTTVAQLMKILPGPDLPTGGEIIDVGGLKDAYTSGVGSFKIRAKVEVGPVSARRQGLTITEMPYLVGTERFIAKCKQVISDGGLTGIADIKDLTDRHHGLKVVVECKTGVDPERVLAELYSKTPLQEAFGVNAVALVNGQPQTLGVREMLLLFLDHRLEVVLRRSKYRLAKAEARAHIVEGLLLALASIDEVVAVIRSAPDGAAAQTMLMERFELSQVQATHILDMPLRRLTGLEVQKLTDELAELTARIIDLRDIIANEDRRRSIVADELAEVAERYGNPRRTKILGGKAAIAAAAVASAGKGASSDPAVEALPVEAHLTASGTVGVVPAGFEWPKRPTKVDAVRAKVAATTAGRLLAVSEKGELLAADVGGLPDGSGPERGLPAGEVFAAEHGDRVVALVDQAVLDAGGHLVIVTKLGAIKRIAADQLAPRSFPVPVIGLKGDDRVAAAFCAPDGADVIIVASDAQLLRLSLEQVRPQGRSAGGMAGIRLKEDAVVIHASAAVEGAHLFTLSDAGNGKVTPIDEYPVKGRGTGGVRAQRFRSGETFLIAAIAAVPDRVVGLDTKGARKPVKAGEGRRDAPGEPLGVAGFAIALA